MGLGAFDVADFVRIIAAPSTRANHRDLQPVRRIGATDTPDLGTSNLTAVSYMTRA
jgi:hypothetical protein